MQRTSVIGTTRRRLLRFKGRYPEICEQTGLGYSWLSKFSRGERGKRPSFDLITALSAALDRLEAADPKPARARKAAAMHATPPTTRAAR